MTKRILLFVAMLFCAVSVFAQDTHTDGQGIKYTLTTNGTTHTAEVSGHTDNLLSEIVIPATIISSNETTYNVTSIGSKAFQGCSGLTSVTIPNSVTSIGSYAFFLCGLTSVNIQNGVTSIGVAAFSNCGGLTSVNIPNSVTSIGRGAFNQCFYLESVIIPSSVTSIGTNVFALCSRITDVYFYCNPENLSWDGQFGFTHDVNVHVLSEYLTKWQEKLKATGSNVTFFEESLDEANTDDQGIKYTLNESSLTATVSGHSDNLKSEIIIPATILSNGKTYSVTSIGSKAFQGCSGLTSVTIPNSVTSIGNEAFDNCDKITSVTIPNSVTSIGEYAFDYCKSLTSVTIPNSVATIGYRAFGQCAAKTSFTIERYDLGNLLIGEDVLSLGPMQRKEIQLKYTGTLHEGFSVAFDLTAGHNIRIDDNTIIFGNYSSEATLTTKEVSGALSITKSNGKYVATIDDNSSSSISLAEDIDVASVTYKRTFEADGGAYTIMLPFSFDASGVKGSFYTLSTLEPTENNSKVWKAIMSDAITDIKAHTPYIFMPSEDFSEMTFSDAEGITLKATTSAPLTNPCANKNWKLHGVYDKKVWTDDDVNDYGFAAATSGDIAVGEFVHFVTGASLKATRCYLEYSEKGFSKSATVLPEKIIVVFPDKTASVIEPSDPDDNGEITTPVSEIAPNNGAKVWAADKTIVIESKAGDQYRIIDLNGRTLRESRLATDREEVTLSHAAGIVVVIVNDKTFKINY